MKPDDLTTGNLAALLSDLLDRDSDKGSPWDLRMTTDNRCAAYRRLATTLGPRYELATLESYEVYDKPAGDRMTQQQCLSAVRNFCDGMPDNLRDGGGLIFFGRPGTGKDHLMAACMYWAILRHGFTIIWRDGPLLAQEIRENVGSEETERSLIDRYVEPLILALGEPIPEEGAVSPWVTDTLQ